MKQSIMFSLLTLCYSIVQINNPLQWQTQENVTQNNTYVITSDLNEQFYVNVTLEMQDSDFYLIITLDQPYNYSNTSAINYLDWIRQKEQNLLSQLENRKTRFIKFQPNGQQVYISTTGKISQQYNLSIIAANKDICPNDCNNQGDCLVLIYVMQSAGCSCHQDYIGNDCHQKASQIYQDIENDLLLEADNLNYFYFSQSDFQKQVEFQLETENINKVQVFLDYTDVLFTPELQNQEGFYQFTEIDSNFPQKVSIANEEQTLKKIILVAKSPGANTILRLKFVKASPSDESESTRLTKIIVPSVVSAVIIAAIIFGIKYYLKRRNNKNKFPFKAGA